MVRLLFCFVLYPAVAADFGPGDGYDVIARNLVAGNGYVIDGAPAAAERLPLYPLLLAASMRVFGDVAWPWQLAQCVCGAVTCGLVLAIARRSATRRGALAAAVLCAVHPTLVLYTARPMTETLYVFLVLLLVAALGVPPPRFRAAGLLWGLQCLLKSTALAQVVALGAAAARHGPRAARAAAVPLVCVLTPWMAWNLWAFGTPHLFSARGGITLYHGLYISQHVGWTVPAGDLNRDAEIDLWAALQRHGVSPQADIVTRDAAAGAIAREWIAAHPAEALRLSVRNLVLTWYLTRHALSMLVHGLLHALLLLAAGIGAARLWEHRQSRDLVVVAIALIVTYTAVHAVIQPAVRYILPVVPVAALLAAAAWGRIDCESVAARDTQAPAPPSHSKTS